MATTTNFGWETPDDTDLVKDGAAAMRTLGNSIDTSFVDLKGGTSGQVLAKASGTDLDFSWVAQDDSNAIQNAIVDAKGDLIAASAADTPARLAVGTNGQVLTADSTTATGLKWATAGGGGKILQVVSAANNTQTSITSTTYTDSGLTATITPTLATSKIMILTSQVCIAYRAARSSFNGIRMLRGATSIGEFGDASGVLSNGLDVDTTTVELRTIVSMSYMDSPATTSATTYKIQGRVGNAANSGTLIFQSGGLIGSIILMEVGA